MENHNENLCKGLHLMFLGAICSIVAAIGALIVLKFPFLAIVLLLATLASAIVSVVGLVKIRNEHADYKNALIALVISFLVGLISRGDGGVMDIIQSIASLLEIYFVIRATNSFLRERGAEEQVAEGDTVWKWNLGVAIGSIVITAIAWMGTSAPPVFDDRVSWRGDPDVCRGLC